MLPAIEVRGLWKRFTLRHNRVESLKGRVLSVFDPRRREQRESFWALQDVSLDVQLGETLGIIGPNGSGKTTLLSLVAGTLQPTSGRIVARGRVSPMLGIGIGFHAELTGQENIYLNGSLLGFSHREVARRYAAIVEFAELQGFIDVCVKNYSTGMQARLGFAIGVHLDPDIMLVDEVLSVGDESFQAKCHDRMRQFRAQGKTIMLVSHSLQTVASLCDRVCLLIHGRALDIGPPQRVIPRYQELVSSMQEGAERILGPELGQLAEVAE